MPSAQSAAHSPQPLAAAPLRRSPPLPPPLLPSAARRCSLAGVWKVFLDEIYYPRVLVPWCAWDHVLRQ
jgi:hypothetical protein